MINQSAWRERSRKEQRADLKASSAQDELFKIRSSRRHSAQMCALFWIESDNNGEQIKLERKNIRRMLLLTGTADADNMRKFVRGVTTF